MKKILVLPFCAIFLLCSCSSKTNEALTNQIGNVQEFDKQKEIDKEHEQLIEHEVNNLPEVSTCQVVVTNHIAYIGINLVNGTNEDNITKIKLKVEELAKSVCDGIEVVSVNASTELFEDSNDINNDDNLNENNDGEEIRENLEQIYKRVMPTV